LENVWKYKEDSVFRAEQLYTAHNYQSFLKTFKASFPDYVFFCPFRGKQIISASLNSITEVYVPRKCLQRLANVQKKDALQTAALDLIEMLSTESRIDMDDFGIHGSIALDMHTTKSDIDLVVYGAQNFRKLEATINNLSERQTLSYVARNRIDAARRYKAKYNGQLFMYNAVRKQEEINSRYGEFKYSPIYPVKLRCTIDDDSEAMFRPAMYGIANCEPSDETPRLIEEMIPTLMVSMIGCYRNVAHKGDRVGVSGMLERVENVDSRKAFYQVVVGTGFSEEEHIWRL
jgi:predicted nucleotidyltransferase